MTRKPVHESHDFRQLIWEALKAALTPVTRGDLQNATGIAPSTIANYLGALVTGGIVERIEADRRPTYRLVRDTGYHAPRLKADGPRSRAGALP